MFCQLQASTQSTTRSIILTQVYLKLQTLSVAASPFASSAVQISSCSSATYCTLEHTGWLRKVRTPYLTGHIFKMTKFTNCKILGKLQPQFTPKTTIYFPAITQHAHAQYGKRRQSGMPTEPSVAATI